MEKPKTIKTLRNLIDSPLELYIDNIIYMKNHFTVCLAIKYNRKKEERNIYFWSILFIFLFLFSLDDINSEHLIPWLSNYTTKKL